jgi:hypothetical protein
LKVLDVLGCFSPICGKKSKVKVKTMFGHREFGDHFKKYFLTKCMAMFGYGVFWVYF